MNLEPLGLEKKRPRLAIPKIQNIRRSFRLNISPESLYDYQHAIGTFTRFVMLKVDLHPVDLSYGPLQQALLDIRYSHTQLRNELQEHNDITSKDMSLITYDYHYDAARMFSEDDLLNDMEDQCLKNLKLELEQIEDFLINNVEVLPILKFFHTKNFYTKVDEALIECVRGVKNESIQ